MKKYSLVLICQGMNTSGVGGNLNIIRFRLFTDEKIKPKDAKILEWILQCIAPVIQFRI